MHLLQRASTTVAACRFFIVYESYTGRSVLIFVSWLGEHWQKCRVLSEVAAFLLLTNGLFNLRLLLTSTVYRRVVVQRRRPAHNEHHHHHHRQPWAQRPLVSDAIVTVDAHRCLSRAAWLNSCRVAPHHCSMSSDHSR